LVGLKFARKNRKTVVKTKDFFLNFEKGFYKVKLPILKKGKKYNIYIHFVQKKTVQAFDQ